MEEGEAYEKISISGPTLASLIQRSISSPCDIDGLLFGHVSRSTSTSLYDDSPSTTATATSSSLIPTITSFVSSSYPLSFYDPLGRPLLPSLRRLSSSCPPSSSLLGFFVARGNTPLRPSMRDVSLSLSLSLLSRSSPLLLLLLSSSSSASFHTHEYRVFQIRPRRGAPALEPRSLDIVNIGPGFRPHYGAFSPNSPFPSLPPPRENHAVSRSIHADKDQRALDACAQGFDVGRLTRLIGPEASNYTSELEDLYAKMLAKMESLALSVEKTSACVLEQENRNIKLRCKVAGSE